MASEIDKAPSVAQTAELAEQQGVDGYDKRADLIARLYMARDMERAGAWSYLFAEAADALAATGQQQVGEVQGDAWALARELRAAMYESDGRFGMADLIRKGHIKDAECGINVLAAALAARQPGAQVPFGWWLEDANGVGYFSRKMQPAALYAHHTTPGYSATPLHAAPPAQGIDLGQQQDAARWRAIAPLLSVEWDEDEKLKRWTWIDFKGDAPAIPSPTRQEYASVDEAVDALISQRDAAPGVGS